MIPYRTRNAGCSPYPPGVIAIPKAASLEHVRDNRAALELALSAEVLAELDGAFPRPPGPVPLEML